MSEVTIDDAIVVNVPVREVWDAIKGPVALGRRGGRTSAGVAPAPSLQGDLPERKIDGGVPVHP